MIELYDSLQTVTTKEEWQSGRSTMSSETGSAQPAQYKISLQQVVKALQTQNVVSPTGSIKTDNNAVSLYTTGNYQSQKEIENQIVGMSKTGAVVHLGSIS